MHSVTETGDCGHITFALPPQPNDELPQYWKIPGMNRVIGITVARDLKRCGAAAVMRQVRPKDGKINRAVLLFRLGLKPDNEELFGRRTITSPCDSDYTSGLSRLYGS